MEKKPLFLFVLVFIVYLFTKAHPSPYNYFVRLADAFLHFRLSLLENPPWLNELVPFQGKYYREKITFACWLAILPIAILLMSHGGTGFTQFGYRYATDFYPFLFLLTFLEMRKLKPYHKFFIIISILVNLWGVVSINKFGFVDW
jgi:hypothetical protein